MRKIRLEKLEKLAGVNQPEVKLPVLPQFHSDWEDFPVDHDTSPEGCHAWASVVDQWDKLQREKVDGDFPEGNVRFYFSWTAAPFERHRKMLEEGGKWNVERYQAECEKAQLWAEAHGFEWFDARELST